MTGYDDTRTAPLLGASTVQDALDILKISGGAPRFRRVVADTTLDYVTDNYILCDAAAGPVVVTLPDAGPVPQGQSFTVMKIAQVIPVDINDVSIAPVGTDLFQGSLLPFSFFALKAGLLSVTFIRAETYLGVASWRVTGVGP
jgi:hypothetical protein